MMRRSITACVDFSDLLAITLPANAKHFDESWVITSPADRETLRVVSRTQNARLFVTDSFYANGAAFNKGRAISECIEHMGKTGLFASIDADTMLPEYVPWDSMRSGNLYSAKRRMLFDATQAYDWIEESKWKMLPRGRDQEHAGYFSVWFADDTHLTGREWFSSQWMSAAGYDSEFQFCWPPECRLWLDVSEVLHIGLDGRNWCGRATQMVDRTFGDNALENGRKMEAMISDRKLHGFSRERLDGKRDL